LSWKQEPSKEASSCGVKSSPRERSNKSFLRT
jgi:hypothetical protein